MASEKQRLTFISYSRVNKEFALRLAKELKSSGFSVWLDQLDIPTGARWDDELEKALEACEIFMVILTPASMTSDNVKDEIGYAIDTNKRILPVLLENATVPFRLRRFQYVDFTTKNYDEGIESAKQLLRNLVNQPTIPKSPISSIAQGQRALTEVREEDEGLKQKIEEERRVRAKVELEREKAERETVERATRETVEKTTEEQAKRGVSEKAASSGSLGKTPDAQSPPRRQRIFKWVIRGMAGLCVIATGAWGLSYLTGLGATAPIEIINLGTYPNADDNSIGDPNAPIRIEEFSDFQCPFCVRFHQEIEPELIEQYVKTGIVQFVYRSMGNWVSQFPDIDTTESQDAALAAYCAGDQNKFWDMHAHLFANVLGENVGSFSDRRIQAIAEEAGLNMVEFNSCYSSGKYEDRVRQDLKDARAAGINGTPAFLFTYTVNGEKKAKLIIGAQPISIFDETIREIQWDINLPDN